MNELFVTSDGSHSLQSHTYGVSYHSRYGAIQETQHIFIDAGLRLKALGQSEIAILELGFGTGLNALMTLLEAQQRDLKVRYTTLEAYPIEPELAAQFNFLEQLGAEGLQDTFLELHRCPWSTWVDLHSNFLFFKQQIQFQDMDFEAEFDVVYFDAFAPGAQPELWETPMMEKVFRALKPGGVMTTYCAKGAVKRTLKSIGFELEALPGPPGKREMTRATKPE
ncbi:MAG: tRNA (5-methylaminomethyl-2-thiouridine)(34)-methyltransferase MnmD [Phaeodactylibacter sp.]|nr:tRNA (5-methylaminomethyl-2-thiouridine)(34)-methyltransferase MnmD [Phaeodactylibacter sp.]